MLKIFSVLLLCLLSLRGLSQDTLAIVSKAEIITASSEDIQQAKSKAASVIADINQAPPLFERMIFLGGGLWDKLKNEPNFKDIKDGNLTFKVPKFNADGSWSSTSTRRR